MKTYLLNVAWLIMVSLIGINAHSQLTINTDNLVELNITCDELAEMSPPTVSTNCEGDIEYSYEDRVFSGGCMGTIERIWTIRDKCNNTNSFQQYIRLIDTIEPELSSYPSNITVALSQIPEVPLINAEDNCLQNLDVEFSEQSSFDENEKLQSIQRTWSVIDKCGNERSHTQIIFIIKNES